MELVEYSERSFAVIGNTKPYKENLKDLGGKFNDKLKCGPGWIFSNSKKEKVQSFLDSNSGRDDLEEKEVPKPTIKPPLVRRTEDLRSLIEPLDMKARMELLGRFVALCNTVPLPMVQSEDTKPDTRADVKVVTKPTIKTVKPIQQAVEDYATDSDEEEYTAPNRKRLL